MKSLLALKKLSSSSKLVEVVLRWSGDAVEVRHLDDADDVLTVGHGADDDLFVPVPSQELVRRTEAGWVVRRLDGSAPFFLADDTGDVVLACGPFTIEVRLVDRARAVTLVPLFDNLWANTATLTMFATAAFLAVVTLMPVGLDIEEPELAMMPPKFSSYFTVQLPKPPTPPLPSTSSEQSSSSAAPAAKLTKKQPRPTSTARPVKPSTDAEVVQSKLAALFGKGGAFGELVGETGSAELTIALGGLKGTRTASASSAPTGTLGLRHGPGSGDTGDDSVDIGRVHTRGRVSGEEDYGAADGLLCGPGKAYPCKEDRVVPEVHLDPPVVEGTLDREIIRRVVREHMASVRACYERELQVTRGLAGKVSLRWVIGADGRVTQAAPSTSSSEREMARVGSCIAKSVRTWRFPAPRGGGVVVVSYPFVLRPSGS